MIDERKFDEKMLLSEDSEEGIKIKAKSALEALSAKELDRFCGVGGSQEINQLLVLIDGRELLLQEETYIGLSAMSDKVTLGKFLLEIDKR